jgi:hypothetical protein
MSHITRHKLQLQLEWPILFERTSMHVSSTSVPNFFSKKVVLQLKIIFPFSSSLLRRPMMTQCITAAVLFGAGDILAQQAVEGKGRKHDVS